jgi:sortase A
MKRFKQRLQDFTKHPDGTRKRLTRKQKTLLMLVFFVLGFTILIYPDIAMRIQANRHHAIIQEYSDEIAAMEAEVIAYELERARIHNASLGGIQAVDPFAPGSGAVIFMEYYSILNINDVMGRIEIPIINVNLPIFHGTSSAVLERGVGHINHPPFPIGGYGNHSLLSAHTGMVTARMFTDLNRLEIGDIFIVTVLDNRIAFQVDRIDTVLPHEIELLVSYDNRDLMTLITCTPYGVNTYRLLVRGERIPYIPAMADDIVDITTPINLRMIIIILFTIAFKTFINSYDSFKSYMFLKKSDHFHYQNTSINVSCMH